MEWPEPWIIYFVLFAGLIFAMLFAKLSEGLSPLDWPSTMLDDCGDEEEEYSTD